MDFDVCECRPGCCGVAVSLRCCKKKKYGRVVAQPRDLVGLVCFIVLGSVVGADQGDVAFHGDCFCHGRNEHRFSSGEGQRVSAVVGHFA